MLDVKFKKLSQYATVPKYKSERAAGADLCACFEDSSGDYFIDLHPGHRVSIPTGIAIELPHGYEGQVRSRSGLASKDGIAVLNSPGTIDEDYRGEIFVILLNTSKQIFKVQQKMRIAQLVISPYVQASFLKASDLSETLRGVDGLGSTGVK